VLVDFRGSFFVCTRCHWLSSHGMPIRGLLFFVDALCDRRADDVWRNEDEDKESAGSN
jgi:hypothetical protein